jgi:hypothetical protein
MVLAEVLLLQMAQTYKVCDNCLVYPSWENAAGLSPSAMHRWCLPNLGAAGTEGRRKTNGANLHPS